MANKFQSLEAGRGIAAMMVVLFHASNKVMAAPKYWNVHVFHGLFDFGHAGVAFFFVLSGFIVAHVHTKDLGHPERLMNYLRSRLLRIYPVYWIVLVLVLATTVVGFNAHIPLTAGVVASSFALVGDDAHSTILAVAWTLYHEIAYYAVFAVAIVAPRAAVAVTVVWVTGVAAAAAGHRFLPLYLANPINLLFAFGIAARWVAIRHARRVPIACAWVGAAAFLAVGMEDVFFPFLGEAARNLLYGGASAVIVAALVARERRRPIDAPAALVALGAASYSIYLVHFPLLGLLARIHSIGAVRAVPADVAFFVLVAAVTIVGMVFRVWVEKPVLDWSNALWHRAAKSLPARPPVVS